MSDIGFFDSNFDEKFMKIEKPIIHIEKNTFYRNVHIFVERVKEMTIVLRFETIKKNLSTCFKESALIWHIVEFTNTFRRILTYEQNVKKWIQTLTQKFKQQTITITINFLKEFYIMKNARKLRKSRKYVQKIIRLIKSAQMKFVFNQFNIIYNEIEVKLKRDLKRSTNMNTINEYFEELNECKQFWWKLTNDRKIQKKYDQNKQY